MLTFARIGLSVTIGVAAVWIVAGLLRYTPLDSVNLGAAAALAALAGVRTGEWLAGQKTRHHFDTQQRRKV